MAERALGPGSLRLLLRGLPDRLGPECRRGRFIPHARALVSRSWPRLMHRPTDMLKWRLLTAMLFSVAFGCTHAEDKPPSDKQLAESTLHRAEKITLAHYARGFSAMLGEPQDAVKEYLEQVPREGPTEGQSIQLTSLHAQAVLKLEEATKQFEAAAQSSPDSMSSLAPIAARCI